MSVVRPLIRPATKSSLEEAVKLVSRLSTSDRRKVLLHIKALNHLEGEPEVEPGEEDWLLDGILTHLRERGLGSSLPPPPIMKKLAEFGLYRQRCLPAKQWLTTHIGHMNRTEQRQLGLIAARSLARKVATFAEVNLRTMLRAVHQIDEAILRSFPGYVECGLLRAIIRSTETGRFKV